MINEQVLNGNWTSLKGQIQETWGDVTDDDLERLKGNVRQLVGFIQEKTGQTQERVEAKLNHMISRTSRRADEVYSRVSEGVQQRYAAAESAVQRRPIESVAVAFGTGLVAGIVAGLVLRSR